MRIPIWFFVLIFAILTLVFLLEYHLVGQAIYGDGRYYWSTARSLYFSHNIDVSDEFERGFNPADNNKTAPFTTTHKLPYEIQNAASSFSLGIAVLWLPFFSLADGLVLILKVFGIPVVRNGFNDIYQITVSLGDIMVVVAGLFILSKQLLQFYKRSIVLLTLILLLFTTNLFYYSSIDALNSHQFSFFLICCLVAIFLTCKQKPKSLYFLSQGLLVGLLAANRTQDGVYILLPLSLLFLGKKHVFQKGLSLLLLAFGTFIGYLPQLLILYTGLHHFTLLPHTAQTFSFTLNNFWGVLFNQKIGILLYMPIILFGFYGLFLFLGKNRFIGSVFLLVFLITFVLIASVNGWGQQSYSVRYFIGTYPLLAFGIAEDLKLLKKHFSWSFIITCTAVLVMHQLIMLAGFKLLLQSSTNVGTNLSKSGQLKLKILNQIQKKFPF